MYTIHRSAAVSFCTIDALFHCFISVVEIRFNGILPISISYLVDNVETSHIWSQIHHERQED